MKRSKILIVDDEPDTLEMLKMALERGPFEVTTASSGAEALESVDADPPDLIILDVMMPPGINGFEVCRILKDNPETKAIHVILLTAVTIGVTSEFTAQIAKIGNTVFDYVEKPADPNFLMERVVAALRS